MSVYKTFFNGFSHKMFFHLKISLSVGVSIWNKELASIPKGGLSIVFS